MGADWLLDNYQLKNGEPSALKSGEEYTIERSFDTDDDGEWDAKTMGPLYDLLFTHKKKDAEIWLQTVPVSGRDEGKELGVLAARYGKAASGSGTVFVRFTKGWVGALTSVTQPRW